MGLTHGRHMGFAHGAGIGFFCKGGCAVVSKGSCCAGGPGSIPGQLIKMSSLHSRIGDSEHALNLEVQDPCTGESPPVQAKEPGIAENSVCQFPPPPTTIVPISLTSRCHHRIAGEGGAGWPSAV